MAIVKTRAINILLIFCAHDHPFCVVRIIIKIREKTHETKFLKIEKIKG
jgi:hypothetical protein